MKLRVNKTTWRAASGVVASMLLMVSFQNCGKAGFDAEMDGALDSASTDSALTTKYGTTKAAKVSGIPFAFDAGFDTISYNSCAESHLTDKSAYFSLRAGAYSTGGIKLNNGFFDYVDQNFKPIYPATALTEDEYKELLADSPANSEAIPELAVRVKNSLSDVYKSGSSAALYKDIVPMVGTLTDPLVMDSFANKGVTANYFPFSPELRVMEGGLDYKSSEAQADEFRNVMMGGGVLALTYRPKGATEIDAVRSESSSYPVKSAYGKGYSLTFTPYPVSGGAATNPNRVLSQIIESDLSSQGGAKAWNCNRAYRVIRAQDAASLCPSHTYSEIKNSASIRTELDIMRRHLRADQWDVNVSLRCVVPKGGISCYKEENLASKGFAEVEYNLTKECFRPNGTYAGATPTSKCMHFVTVCTRD